MWFVIGRIRGDGNSRRWQSPEFLLVDLGISMASFYKHCSWWWPSDIKLLQARCSCGSEEPLVLVFPYLETLDSHLKVSCLLKCSRHLHRDSLLYTVLMTAGEICYKVYWIETTDPCVADSPENLLSFLKRLILMTYTMKVILPWSHWDMYWLAFLWRRGAVFHCQGGS